MPTLFWFLLGMFIDTTAGIFAMGLCAACRFPTTPLMEDEDRTWSALQKTKDERCDKCGRMFWHHIKTKMNLEV